MSIKSDVTIGMTVLLIATVIFTQCAKKESAEKNAKTGCDESSIQAEVAKMQGRLDLNEKQVSQFIGAIHEIHKITDEDRAKFKGDNEGLLKAAKARNAMKKARMESFLDDKQKAKFREIMSKKQVTDRTLLFGERLGLDCEMLEQLNPIVMKSPSDEEALKIKKSGDAKKIEAFKSSTQNIHKEIEALLTPEQIVEFRKMIDEKSASMGKALKS